MEKNIGGPFYGPGYGGKKKNNYKTRNGVVLVEG